MVMGLERFKEHFAEYKSSFVVIGGSACFAWLGSSFRKTKDIDMVLFLEDMRTGFVARFREFIRSGGYQNYCRTSGEPTYYRFEHPTRGDYPFMLELFSRQPFDIELADGQRIVPVWTEEVGSLSAILMDEPYYRLLQMMRAERDGLPVVRIEGLIPLKAKAYLDLKKRKEAGEHVNAADLTKHRNDVFRLAMELTGDRENVLEVPIREDMKEFLSLFPAEASDWNAILASLRSTAGRSLRPEELVAAIKGRYRL